MKLLGYLFILVGVGLLILVVGGYLGREAGGLVLGVAFGVVATLPAALLARRRPAPRVEYRDRIVYRVATVEHAGPCRWGENVIEVRP